MGLKTSSVKTGVDVVYRFFLILVLVAFFVQHRVIICAILIECIIGIIGDKLF